MMSMKDQLISKVGEETTNAVYQKIEEIYPGYELKQVNFNPIGFGCHAIFLADNGSQAIVNTDTLEVEHATEEEIQARLNIMIKNGLDEGLKRYK